MKVMLLRDSRIMHKAGEIVEVSPTEHDFLLDVQSAVDVEEDKQEEEPKPRTRRSAKK